MLLFKSFSLYTRFLPLLSALVFSLAFAFYATLSTTPKLVSSIDKKKYRKKEAQDVTAALRIKNWQKLIETSGTMQEEERLQLINHFFNGMPHVDDFINWSIKDYWATPFEFLATGGGDCEDFAIAKYFTLIAMGVAEERLRITYVRTEYNQAHMVLTYFSTPRTEPLVLDNLNSDILPASQRKDLLPVYSFNGTSMWIAKSFGNSKLIGAANRLSLWQDLKSRMQTLLASADFVKTGS